jgi:hypothetical protein
VTRRIFAQRTSPPPIFNRHEDYLTSPRAFCTLLQRFSPQPWVSVVLGSGWLSTSERESAMASILRRLANALTVLDAETWLADLPDGSDLAETAQRFAADLVADRLNIPRGSAAGALTSAHLDRGDEWVAKVLVTSMLGTNLYFTLRAVDPAAAMHRTGHEEVATEAPGSTALWINRQLTARLADALVTLGEELAAEGSGARVFAAKVLDERDQREENVTQRLLDSFRAVVDSMSGTLMPAGGAAPRLLGADVRALSELAWFSLSSFAVNTYPGWLDMLLELSHYDEPRHGFVGHPSFDNMTEAGDAIRARYRQLTKDSWSRLGQEGRQSSALHKSVAALLVAQWRLRSEILASSTRPPPLAVAHVTSFDLELEIALLRTKQPFHVIFPVHIHDSANELLHLRWCKLEVRSGDLAAVTNPDPDAVAMLSGEAGELDDVSGPLVVRLVGCPLIELPQSAVEAEPSSLVRQVLGSTSDGRPPSPGDKAVVRAFRDGWKAMKRTIKSAELEWRLTRELTIRHAVIVNEHDAMLHNAMDNQPDDEPSLRRRLPIDTVANDNDWRRFWMLLGVQIGDHAVRQRVSHVVAWYPASDTRQVAQESKRIPRGERHPEADEGGSEKDEVETGAGSLGVLVSRHVGHLEKDLLYWNRFDIVENADAHLFAGDLDHVSTVHLTEGDAGRMIRCHGG